MRLNPLVGTGRSLVPGGLLSPEGGLRPGGTGEVPRPHAHEGLPVLFIESKK